MSLAIFTCLCFACFIKYRRGSYVKVFLGCGWEDCTADSVATKSSNMLASLELVVGRIGREDHSASVKRFVFS